MVGEVMVFELEHDHDTKNFVAFKNADDSDDVQNIYVRKSSFTSGVKRVKVTVEVLKCA